MERSQILASSLILPPSGATHPHPRPNMDLTSQERGPSLDLGPFKQLEATLDSADCPSLLLKLDEREKFEEKLRDEDERVGKESLSGFRGFIPTLLK